MAALGWIVSVVMRGVAVYHGSLLRVSVCTAWVRCLHYRIAAVRAYGLGVSLQSLYQYISQPRCRLLTVACISTCAILLCIVLAVCLACSRATWWVPLQRTCPEDRWWAVIAGVHVLSWRWLRAGQESSCSSPGLDVCWRRDVLSTNHGYVRIVRSMLV